MKTRPTVEIEVWSDYVLAHVAQYERFGGFRSCLFQYLQECINPGYPLGELELEAKRAEGLWAWAAPARQWID